MHTTLADILRAQTRELVVAQVNDPIAHAVQRMNEERVGSVLVLDEDQLSGILTERDILTRVIGAQRNPRTEIAEVMTTPVLCVSPKMRVDQTMRLMTDQRTRHLPIVADGILEGLVSMGDLTHWITRELAHSVDELARYIGGPAVVAESALFEPSTATLDGYRVSWGSSNHERISVAPPPPATA